MDTIDWGTVGRRIALLRLRKGRSIRDLATLARVDKNTVLRIERGMPVRMASFHRICMALQTTIGRQTLGLAERDEGFRVSRVSERKWIKSVVRTSPSDPVGDPRLNVQGSRWVRGWTGTEPTFNGLIDCELFDGAIVSSVVEVFGPTPPQSHPGEELVYAVRGAVIVSIADTKVALNEGDAICFWANRAHFFTPAATIRPGTPPPMVLSVRAEAGSPAAKKRAPRSLTSSGR